MLRATRIARIKLPLKPAKPFQLYEATATNLPALREEVEIDGQTLLKHYEDMYRLRRMETLCDQGYKQKKIRGFCHLYVGQEAIAVGMESELTKEDSIVTAYRDHAWYVMRGGEPYDVFAEMMGKQSGCSKGKGGSMHMYLTKNNFFGGNGIVGAQVPIGLGLAYKHSYTNGVESPKNVAIALYGDGAANQGQIFEAFNMAALWKIPCIFVCENNQFGMGTSKTRASADPNFYRRCEYIPGLKMDGMDVLAVAEGTRWAKEYALAGNGPVILEMDSYRYMGHSLSDPGNTYRSREDVQHVREQRDCIAKLGETITKNGIATEADLKALEKTARKKVDEQWTKAEKSADTDMSELITDILTEPTHPRSTQGTVFI